MSYFDYVYSRQIAAEYDFYAILMAAMRNADTDNLAKLKAAFPETHQELLERYNNPGGLTDKELKRGE